MNVNMNVNLNLNVNVNSNSTKNKPTSPDARFQAFQMNKRKSFSILQFSEI